MTSAKPPIVFCMRDSCTNLKQLVLQERFLNGSIFIYLTDGNGWFFQVYLLFGNYIRAGVRQGSILGPLLYLFFMNDIVNGIDSNIRLFADDTSLFIIVENAPYAATYLNLEIRKKAR